MSKTYSMPGWRRGGVAENRNLISALARVKSYLKYSAFTPIQTAAATALNGTQDCIVEACDIYKVHRDFLLTNAGWHITSPPATIFEWVPISTAFKDMGLVELSKRSSAEANVAVAPGLGFGENGQCIRQMVRNIKGFLRKRGVNNDGNSDDGSPSNNEKSEDTS